MQHVIEKLAIELYFVHNCKRNSTGLSYIECLEFARMQVLDEYYYNKVA